MSLGLLPQLVATATMVMSIGFGIPTFRQDQEARRGGSASLKSASFRIGEFVQGLRIGFGLLPAGAKAEIDPPPSDTSRRVALSRAHGNGWECSCCIREVELDFVSDAYTGPILLSWDKLARFANGCRLRAGRQSASERFPWLAGRLAA